ncbi:hypothetical protein B0T20DRAFT_357474 [Sordaria brevicollis]|uniref:Elongator complex protein 6 n=1 Tax=Sordaria brevicollis TaxID=83679 RepID=A0AAE0PA04_SORBR|nr:hypothetical protein B0T20DRAFT_357474 [Sordaria brevicollis]
MTSRTIPPLLEPYLSPPLANEHSQILLTGILGANTNWLLLRYLYTLLKSSKSSSSSRPATQPQGQRRLGPRIPVAAEPELEFANSSANGGDVEGEEDAAVLLVSFLRDFAFWKESAGRLGLDLEGLGRKGRLGFVDGLCIGSGPGSGSDVGGGGLPVRGGRPLVPTGGAAVPGRGLPPAATAPARAVPASASASTSSHGQGPTGGGDKWKRSLPSLAVADVSKTLHAALDELCQKNKKVVLVMDQLDFLVAATSDGNGPSVSSALRDLLLDLREKSHATILTLSADDPLIASQTTTLEKDHASFVLSLAHEAEMILSLRLLDTGIAKDVSGVIRITRGGDSGSERQMEEKEYLYHVGGDGGVRVFERGQ